MASARGRKLSKNLHRMRVHERVRQRVAGTTERPRLCVYRSLGHIYAQVIDDLTGKTLVSASSVDGETKKSELRSKNEGFEAWMAGVAGAAWGLSSPPVRSISDP